MKASVTVVYLNDGDPLKRTRSIDIGDLPADATICDVYEDALRLHGLRDDQIKLVTIIRTEA